MAQCSTVRRPGPARRRRDRPASRRAASPPGPRRAGSTGPARKRRAAAPLPAPRAWIGVVSRAHVLRGVAGGFAQLGHGKRQPLDRMAVGDWLVYYSPSTELRGGVPLRAFTALGRVVGPRAYAFDMGGGFVPFRRDVAYEADVREVPVAALAPALHFVQRSASWGMLARRGHFEIDRHDLEVIRTAMRAAV